MKNIALHRVLEFVMWALLVVALLWSIPAFALDFSQKVTDDKGSPIVVGGKEWTLGNAVATALYANLPGDEKLDGGAKMERAILALRIKDSADVQVSAEEIATMKKATGAAYGPLVIYRVWALLDPASVAKPVKTETVPAPETPKE